MAGTGGERHHGLVDEQTVYAALDAIDEALEQALVAASEREQRWQLNQLRGLLLMVRLRDLVVTWARDAGLTLPPPRKT